MYIGTRIGSKQIVMLKQGVRLGSRKHFNYIYID